MSRAGASERLGEVGRQRRLDVDPLARQRMLERQARRVQELALEAQVAGNAVDRVARDREPDRLEVHADLVRAPRLESNLEQRVPRQQLERLEVRDRLARGRGVERVARAVDAVAADRRLDPARPGLRSAL